MSVFLKDNGRGGVTMPCLGDWCLQSAHDKSPWYYVRFRGFLGSPEG
jgi:hypothetical protein